MTPSASIKRRGMGFTVGSKQLISLALHNKVPAIYQFREFTAADNPM
jgi:hypothetical protein